MNANKERVIFFIVLIVFDLLLILECKIINKKQKKKSVLVNFTNLNKENIEYFKREGFTNYANLVLISNKN